MTLKKIYYKNQLFIEQIYVLQNNSNSDICKNRQLLGTFAICT